MISKIFKFLFFKVYLTGVGVNICILASLVLYVKLKDGFKLDMFTNYFQMVLWAFYSWVSLVMEIYLYIKFRKIRHNKLKRRD